MMNHILEFFAEEEDNAEEEEIAEESKVVSTTPMTTTAAAAVGALHTDLKQIQNPVLYPPPHRCHFHNFIPIASFCSLMRSSSSNAPSSCATEFEGFLCYFCFNFYNPTQMF
jgi:hypothetical protein